MRISHKYLRNRHYRLKHWKRVRSWSHPFRTLCPYYWYPYSGEQVFPPWWNTEKQIQWNFERIERQARAIENGETHFTRLDSAPKWCRKMINKRRKAAERRALRKTQNGYYDTEFPKFKPDAAWDYW